MSTDSCSLSVIQTLVFCISRGCRRQRKKLWGKKFYSSKRVAKNKSNLQYLSLLEYVRRGICWNRKGFRPFRFPMIFPLPFNPVSFHQAKDGGKKKWTNRPPAPIRSANNFGWIPFLIPPCIDRSDYGYAVYSAGKEGSEWVWTWKTERLCLYRPFLP